MLVSLGSNANANCALWYRYVKYYGNLDEKEKLIFWAMMTRIAYCVITIHKKSHLNITLTSTMFGTLFVCKEYKITRSSWNLDLSTFFYSSKAEYSIHK